MTDLLATYALIFTLATIGGFIFGSWMTRRKFVAAAENNDALCAARSNSNASQWEKLWKRLDAIPDSGKTNLVGVNKRLDALAYAVTNLAEPPYISVPSTEVRLQEVNKAATTLKEPMFGQKDKLRLISGIGMNLERLLNRHGIFYFWQISAWTDRDIKFIDERLDTYRGGIVRDDWVGQADRLRREEDSAQAPTEMRISA